MIRQLTGVVVEVLENQLVLTVSGVGYLVRVSDGEAYVVDTTYTLWTHQAVRENALDLYGFTNRDELMVFELLLTLPKIGPRSALNIMTQADVTLLRKAVAQDDAGYLSKMSGLGKKTAEKIVAGLREVFEKQGLAPATSEPVASWQQEAVDALVTLGYPQKDAREAVSNLPANTKDVSAAVSAALRQLSA